MTNTKTFNRNDDLIPLIVSALDHNKAGNDEQRDVALNSINQKLTERGDNVGEFWAGWVALMKSFG